VLKYSQFQAFTPMLTDGKTEYWKPSFLTRVIFPNQYEEKQKVKIKHPKKIPPEKCKVLKISGGQVIL